MKNYLIILITLLFATSAGAMPRRQHLLQGKIVSVDLAARSFGVESPTSGLVAVKWNETTKIKTNKVATTAATLAAGQIVRLYYRIEIGVNVAREISIEQPGPPKESAAR